MGQTSVNIRERKSRLSHYLRLTKAVESIVTTERGTPIGRIIPTAAPVKERMEAMAETGLALWNKKQLKAMSPVAKVHGKHTVANLLIKDRE